MGCEVSKRSELKQTRVACARASAGAGISAVVGLVVVSVAAGVDSLDVAARRPGAAWIGKVS